MWQSSPVDANCRSGSASSPSSLMSTRHAGTRDQGWGGSPPGVQQQLHNAPLLFDQLELERSGQQRNRALRSPSFMRAVSQALAALWIYYACGAGLWGGAAGRANGAGRVEHVRDGQCRTSPLRRAIWKNENTRSPAADVVGEVVVIGDIHGDLEALVGLLKAVRLLNSDVQLTCSTLVGVDRQAPVGSAPIQIRTCRYPQNVRWTGGARRLVQLGDVVDRGPDGHLAWGLLRHLQRLAPRDGGAVHLLFGNHEVMRLCGDASGAMLETAIHFGGRTDLLHAEWRRTSDFGAWIRKSLDVSLVLFDYLLFVHAGLHPDFASHSSARLKSMFLRRIDDKQCAPILRESSGAEQSPVVTSGPGEMVIWDKDILFGSRSPVWFRDFATNHQVPGVCAHLREALARASAAANSSHHTSNPVTNLRVMLVGHTITNDWEFEQICNGRTLADVRANQSTTERRVPAPMFMLDTGASRFVMGRPSALRILVTTQRSSRRQPLPLRVNICDLVADQSDGALIVADAAGTGGGSTQFQALEATVRCRPDVSSVGTGSAAMSGYGSSLLDFSFYQVKVPLTSEQHKQSYISSTLE